MPEEKRTLESIENKYGSLNKTLVGVDGNAFAVMAHFRKNARRAGWDREDIDFVLEEAKKDDYDHLLGVITRFTE